MAPSVREGVGGDERLRTSENGYLHRRRVFSLSSSGVGSSSALDPGGSGCIAAVSSWEDIKNKPLKARLFFCEET